MNNHTDISIIIPVYNAALLLNRCLDSVFAQTKQYSIEVILIDDGSTDTSIEIIQKRKEKNIILLQQKNSGPAAARNKGIEVACGEFLAFIDADDYWLPGFIEKTIKVLKTNASLVAVSTMQKHIIIGKEPSTSPSYSPNSAQTIVLDDFFSFWATYNHVCTGSVMMRTEAVKRTGGQRTELRITEDLEFWAYLATMGQWAFIPEILFVSDGGIVAKQIGWLEKNKKRWGSAPTIEEWEKRIITQLPNPYPEGYLRARGRIAKNLCYSILLSKRNSLAWMEIKKHQRYFPTDKISKLLQISSYNKLTWWIISRLLVYREYHRK